MSPLWGALKAICSRGEQSKLGAVGKAMQTMRPLQIKPAAVRETPGDLRARLKDDNLLLPDRVAMAFAALGIRTAADLVSYLQAFPTSVADELGWEPQDVHHALALLRKQLRGRVDDSILNPSLRREPAYGAVLPTGANDRDR